MSILSVCQARIIEGLDGLRVASVHPISRVDDQHQQGYVHNGDHGSAFDT